VLSHTGNPGRARDLVTEAFAEVLPGSGSMSQESFRIALFSTARTLCRNHPRAIRLDLGLSDEERDAVTLFFDSQLSLAEASAVCGVKKLERHLYRALQQMRRNTAPLEVPPFFRLG
jgi:DNA-directed RNA polymerase specialized sigma24 family protein